MEKKLESFLEQATSQITKLFAQSETNIRSLLEEKLQRMEEKVTKLEEENKAQERKIEYLEKQQKRKSVVISQFEGNKGGDPQNSRG